MRMACPCRFDRRIAWSDEGRTPWWVGVGHRITATKVLRVSLHPSLHRWRLWGGDEVRGEHGQVGGTRRQGRGCHGPRVRERDPAGGARRIASAEISLSTPFLTSLLATNERHGVADQGGRL